MPKLLSKFYRLPTPVFVLDGQNRFVYLNQAGEMFFHSSKPLLIGFRSIVLSQQIDTVFDVAAVASSICRCRSGFGIGQSKNGPKLVNANHSFGETPPRLLLSIQERALAERLRDRFQGCRSIDDGSYASAGGQKPACWDQRRGSVVGLDLTPRIAN